jgi:hypothetical protein
VYVDPCDLRDAARGVKANADPNGLGTMPSISPLGVPGPELADPVLELDESEQSP